MHLPEQILARLQRLTCVPNSTRVQFRLPDGSDFYLQVQVDRNSECASENVPLETVQVLGVADNADLELEMSFKTLNDIVDGQLSARHAFLLGDICFTGNRQLAAALADLFSAHG
ncbi:SCP2 sterol-binding domain-containing protein [Microbulbifer bruguierae]|uniref:SCP2 sterol-binding domain-containing protein n=1 Tax=Microbulbifer bruguierae TaxID=3029061 RepID=A0ABY8NH70_9GAMM|nr:SCP2 sterol-binding domain-containing protein [Microbulbifer bruguierae]WGL17407.1 SCP2 sterol-binding domain-containing protein [Microbulbifer bruguierae]